MKVCWHRWASTCQTVGMNTGYFASFTFFLALNDPSFCNRQVAVRLTTSCHTVPSVSASSQTAAPGQRLLLCCTAVQDSCS